MSYPARVEGLGKYDKLATDIFLFIFHILDIFAIESFTRS